MAGYNLTGIATSPKLKTPELMGMDKSNRQGDVRDKGLTPESQGTGFASTAHHQ